MAIRSICFQGKTAEGIRKFAADIAKLEKFVVSKDQLMKRH